MTRIQNNESKRQRTNKHLQSLHNGCWVRINTANQRTCDALCDEGLFLILERKYKIEIEDTTEQNYSSICLYFGFDFVETLKTQSHLIHSR